MSTSTNTSGPSASTNLKQHTKPTAHRRSLTNTPAALAHELANLLDGSLRNVNLVLHQLRELDAHPSDDPASLDRLEAANHAMEQMATLIKRWTREDQQPDQLHNTNQTVGKTIEHALKLLTPAASIQGIDFQTRITDDAAQINAGPLFPIVTNTIRNSIEAISLQHQQNHKQNHGLIQIDCKLQNKHLVLTIADNGPGISSELIDDQGCFQFGLTTKVRGHGIGMALSNDIANRMGGIFHLANRPPEAGHTGALMTLKFPINATPQTERSLA